MYEGLDRDRMIRDIFSDSNKLTKFASSLREPLRTSRDYKSIVRELFVVEQVTANGLVYWQTDVDAIAVQLGADGQTVKTYAGFTTIPAVWTRIMSNVAVSVPNLNVVTYDLVQRSIDKMRSHINMTEDTYGFTVLDQLVTNNTGDSRFPNLTFNATGTGQKLAPYDVSTAIGVIEAQTNDRVAVMVINPQQASSIRTWGNQIFDFSTQRELLQKGYIGTIYGVNVISTPQCPTGYVYFLGQKQLLGRMPIATDLTPVPAPNPQNLEIGFILFEVIGLLAYNPGALVRVAVT